MRVNHQLFDPRKGFERGRPAWVLAGWYLIKLLFFLSAFPWPSSWKTWILRRFGARIGTGVYFKPRINIHFPWKLAIGDYSWIGEEVEIYNFELVQIGAHCCISQRAFLCAGNHDFRDPGMNYRHAPVTVEAGAWIGACSFVGPGVTVGGEAVVTAGSVVSKSLPPAMVCSGNPCVPVRSRWK
jgi:putative colanic acid biosynthesis acetyltransferase WcaF